MTQLKWRLLEGNGQAYYELGVADSGQLVGLPRVDLERTLETPIGAEWNTRVGVQRGTLPRVVKKVSRVVHVIPC